MPRCGGDRQAQKRSNDNNNEKEYEDGGAGREVSSQVSNPAIYPTCAVTGGVGDALEETADGGESGSFGARRLWRVTAQCSPPQTGCGQGNPDFPQWYAGGPTRAGAPCCFRHLMLCKWMSYTGERIVLLSAGWAVFAARRQIRGVGATGPDGPGIIRGLAWKNVQLRSSSRLLRLRTRCACRK